ncbi:hypothetical protein D3C84_385700 [compost metagenome]
MVEHAVMRHDLFFARGAEKHLSLIAGVIHMLDDLFLANHLLRHARSQLAAKTTH